MSERYFEPWIGKNYDASRILILSKSTYNWLDDDGQVVTPQPTHARNSVLWNTEHFGKVSYFTLLNRALCRDGAPSPEKMQAVWEDYAYTVFIQEPVGLGAGTRPTTEQWREAGHHFLSLLEELRPLKVIVTGKDMWNLMPDCCAVRLLDDLQAYRLKDKSLVWCLALPHPANRSAGVGFRWDEIGESISLFKAATFPSGANHVHSATASMSP